MVDKKGEALLKLLLVVAGVSVILAMSYFVLAASIQIAFDSGMVASASNMTISMNSSVQATFNISVNNTLLTGGSPATSNITQVNITLPANLTFVTGTNDSVGGPTDVDVVFTNTSTVLSWKNISGLIGYDNATTWFVFNISAVAVPAMYNITVSVLNMSGGLNMTNLTVIVNDTTFPLVSYGVGTEGNGANVSRNWIYVNISVTELDESKVLFSLYNETGVVNRTQFSLGNRTFNTSILNALALNDGVYNYSVWINDTSGNLNVSGAGNRTIRLDRVAPSVYWGANSLVDLANSSSSFISLNVTANDTANVNNTFSQSGIMNITVYIYNSSTLVNSSSTNGIVGDLKNLSANLSGMADGIYSVNFSATDYAGNVNWSSVRTVTVDTTFPLVSYGVGTEVNGANVSRGEIYVNVSVTELNERQVLFKLYNSTGAVNITIFNAGNRTFNMSKLNALALNDGVYTYNVSVNDSSGNLNDSGAVTRKITLDRVLPIANWGADSMASGLNLSSITSISFGNMSANDTSSSTVNFSSGIFNITAYLYTATAIINTSSTNGVIGNLRNLSANLSGISGDGTYYINFSVTDYAGNVNWSTVRTLKVDSTIPSIALASVSATTSSVTVNITIVDTTSIDATCIADRGGASVTGTGYSQSFTETGLSCGSTYTYIVRCTDDMGLQGAGSGSFATSSCGTSGGSSGGGGGGSAGGYVWAGTYTVDNAVFSSGSQYTKELSAKDRVKYSLGNIAHYVGVLEVGTASAKIVVASTPQEATMNVGEIKKFEVSGDNYLDVEVTLNGVKDGKADLSIRYINEIMSVEEVAARDAAEEAAAVAAGSGDAGTAGEAGKTGISKTIWIVIGVIVIIAVVVWMIFARKK